MRGSTAHRGEPDRLLPSHTPHAMTASAAGKNSTARIRIRGLAPRLPAVAAGRISWRSQASTARPGTVPSSSVCGICSSWPSLLKMVNSATSCGSDARSKFSIVSSLLRWPAGRATDTSRCCELPGER